MKKMLLVVNPCSGQKKAKRYLADIVDVFNRADFDATVYITASRGDATRLCAERAGEFDRVVCSGGDGTFNEVLSGVLQSGAEAPIGYLPSGSTNDFANSLHLSKDLLQAARDAATGVPMPFDVGRFNDRYFSYIASFGAFTRASYATSQSLKNALGHLAYLLAGIKEIPAICSRRLRFTLPDGTAYEDDYIFGAVSNSTSVAGVLTLDPSIVDMADGKFELLLIRKPKNLLELNDCVLALATQEYNTPMLTLVPVQQVCVTAPEDMAWTLDGERADGRTECTIENLHHAVSVLLPEGSV